jgi:serine/threonine protein phosphatase PrpC
MTGILKPVIDVQSNPVADMMPTYFSAEPFQSLVAYARSADAHTLNEYNQDAFAIRASQQRFVAVVADGVGQSFRGDVAAMAVAQSMMNVLWHTESLADHDIRDVLYHTLIELAPKVSSIIGDIDLSHYPTMFREALMQRRAFGSESVFVALVIDIPLNVMRCFWLGDCRIRIYDTANNHVPIDPATFQTMERWSSTRRIHGNMHTLQMPVTQLSRVVLYSDGLHTLDDLTLIQPDMRDIITTHMQNSHTSPESDDITIIMVDV